jgi:hypothetical protein
MIALLSISGAAALAAVLYYMRLFDSLVRWEYHHHHEQWERDGKPDGFFWRGEGCVPWSSGVAKKRLDVSWLFKTPGWAAQVPQCRRWLLQRRIISAAAALVVLILFARLLFGLVY